MSKRKFVESTKGNKKSRDTFKLEWLRAKVTTDTPDLKSTDVELSTIYEYTNESGLNCKICTACSSYHPTKVTNMQLESAEMHGN